MSLPSDVCTSVVPRPSMLMGTSTPQAYLVAIATAGQQPLLGDWAGDCPQLNGCGLIAADEWVRSARSRRGIEVEGWVITPSQLQSIVWVQPSAADEMDRRATGDQKPWLLSSFVASFKAAAAKRINLQRNQPGQVVWQSSYRDCLITDVAQLAQLRQQMQNAQP